MRSLYFIPCVAACLAAVAGGASAQPRAPESSASSLTIFMRGTPVGAEQVTLSRSADGWTISTIGRLGAPIDAVARKVEVRYTADWRPLEFTFDGLVRGTAQQVHTVVDGTQAKSDITIGGQPTQRNDAIDANAILILPNTFFGMFEAVAARLKLAAEGSDIPVYGVPSVSFGIRVGSSSAQQIQTTARVIRATRTQLTLAFPGAALAADMWTDEAGRMIRFSVPAQGLEVVREDVAAVSSRSVAISRPNDEPIKIAANGFVLAGTLSRPTQAAASPRLPAVVLVGGSGPTDRDSLLYGIPILGELAGAIADAGFIVVRYDKRGIGQSGGRAESAGLAEYAEDVRAVVKALSDRKDVDPKRLAVVGHSDGGTVALLAAAKDKRITAVALLATPGVTGAELILAQQQHSLGRSKMSPAEKQAAVDLQRRIHDAVVTGKGWEQLPINIRRSVDNPEFQSLLTNDPAKVIPEVRQPILILQGTLDTKVDPSNADRLLTLAKARKNAPPVDFVKVPGANHLLEQATTGEEDEYGSLPDKHVSKAVTQALVEWLQKTR
jgi:uncharacterized protein